MKDEFLSGQLYEHIVYSPSRWELLKAKRERAKQIMKVLLDNHIPACVYGSIARGDVNEDSDVDVFVDNVINPDILESIIEREIGRIEVRTVVQATPSHVVKGYIYLDPLTTVSFPLIEMTVQEEEFYRVAGRIGLEDLLNGKRVAGMNKSLKVIVPVKDGHMEFPAESNPDLAASIIGVSPSALRERVNVLRRRFEHGRTGVYREIELSKDESFGYVLEKLIRENPLLKKRLNR